MEGNGRIHARRELPVFESFVAAPGIACTAESLRIVTTAPVEIVDLTPRLERLAPRAAGYAHDALHLRDDVPPDERPNGHAHAKALLLRTSETLHVASGRLRLGRWQRLLLLELDGPRERELSLVALGTVRP